MSDIERGGLSVETGLDSRNAFREAYAAAEQDAAKEAGLTGDGQPRDPDTGQFTADTPAEPVVEQVEEPAADEVDPEKIEKVREKYNDDSDAIAAAYASLQRKLDEQGAELGELRKMREQLSSVEDRLSQPQPVHQPVTPDLIESNPAAATQMAFEQADQYTLAVAYEQWKLDDPASAAVWLNTKNTEKQLYEMEQKYEQRIAEIEQRVAPIQARDSQAELARSVQQLPEGTQAFLADAATVQKLAQEFPTIGNTIVNGAPDERVEAVRALYDIHRGRTADTLQRTAQDVARDTAEAAQAAREDAYVASSTSSQEQPKTPEQVEQEKMVAAFTRKQSTWDEAFVRPPKR